MDETARSPRQGVTDSPIDKLWHVLLVDDDDAIRRVLTRMIRSDGHTVVEASNGVDGLRALDIEPVDLVITDVVMPDMEGLEFVRQIRKRRRRLKVIVISGGGRAAGGNYLELARMFGADGTLSKPFSADDLRTVISQVMRGD